MFANRQPIGTGVLPSQALSPLRIATPAFQQQNVPVSAVGVHNKGVAPQVPSGSTSGGFQKHDAAASHATELSSSEQRLLQHLGWSLGRRGLEVLKAVADRSHPSHSTSPMVLKDFWSHCIGLSWLPHQQPTRAEQKEPKLQHELQPAQHDDHHLAQQGLQQAALQAKLDTLYDHNNVPHEDSDGASQLHDPSAGHMATKNSGFEELVHPDMVQQLPVEDPPMPKQASPQHAKGRNARIICVHPSVALSTRSELPLLFAVHITTHCMSMSTVLGSMNVHVGTSLAGAHTGADLASDVQLAATVTVCIDGLLGAPSTLLVSTPCI